MKFIDAWLSVTRLRSFRVMLGIISFILFVFLAWIGIQHSDTVWSETPLKNLSPQSKHIASIVYAAALIIGGAFASYSVATSKGKLIADD